MQSLAKAASSQGGGDMKMTFPGPIPIVWNILYHNDLIANVVLGCIQPENRESRLTQFFEINKTNEAIAICIKKRNRKCNRKLFEAMMY